MLELIVLLKALSIFSKDDAHYSFKGINFKPLHEWADEINSPLQGFIDEIKENYFLARNIDLPRGTEINDLAKQYVPAKIGKNEDILKSIYALMNMANNQINKSEKSIENIMPGDQDLIGRIGSYLQHHMALLQLALKGDGND